MVSAHDECAAVSLIITNGPRCSAVCPGTSHHKQRGGGWGHTAAAGADCGPHGPSPRPLSRRCLHPGGLGLPETSRRRWSLAGGPGDTREGPLTTQPQPELAPWCSRDQSLPSQGKGEEVAHQLRGAPGIPG